jgi:DNA-binding MarR family transcriptional regulator
MVASMQDEERPRWEPRLSYLVARLERVIRARLSAALERFDISVTQYTVLSVLERRPDLSNAQLARRSYITAQAMHQTVNRLEERGLIARTVSPRHGRIQLTRLTAAGALLLRCCDEAVEGAEGLLFASLGPDDRRRLRRLIQACVDSGARALGGVAGEQ